MEERKQIDKLFQQIETILNKIDEGKSITKTELNQAYVLCYDTMENIFMEHDYACEIIEGRCKRFFGQKIERLKKSKEENKKIIPHILMELFEQWKLMKVTYTFIFSSLDYCPHIKVNYTVKMIMKEQFELFYTECVIGQIGIFNEIQSLISQARFDNGMEAEVYLSIHKILDYHLNDQFAYQLTVFLQTFIEKSKNDFATIVERLLKLPIEECITQLMANVERERTLTKKCLLQPMEEEFEQILYDHLIVKFTEQVQQHLIELLEGEKKEVICMIGLMWDGHKEIDTFKTIIQKYVVDSYTKDLQQEINEKKESMTIKSTTEFILGQRTYFEELKRDYFKHAKVLLECVNDAMKLVFMKPIPINQSDKSVETIVASYIHSLLARSNASTLNTFSSDIQRKFTSSFGKEVGEKIGGNPKQIQKEIESKITPFLDIIQCFSNRETFFSIYKTMLMKRIIQRTLFVFKVEQRFVNELYSIESCSESYKLKKMLEDYQQSMILSKQLNDEKKFGYSTIQPELLILSKFILDNHEYPRSTVPLVDGLEFIWKIMESEYLQDKQRQRLTYHPSLSSVVVNYTIPSETSTGESKNYTMTMSYIQYLILYYLRQKWKEGKTSVPITEIHELVGPLYDGFHSQLKTMIACGILKLSSSPQNKANRNDLTKNIEFNYGVITETFLLNKMTKTKRKQPKEQVVKEVIPLEERMFNQVISFLAKYMKREKTKTVDDLINLTLDHFKNIFDLSSRLVKQGIDYLIEKEYLEKDKEDSELLHYTT